MISDQKLIELYTAMVTSRLLAQRTSLAQNGDKSQKPTASHEATAAALAVDLLAGDFVAAPKLPLQLRSRKMPLHRVVAALAANDSPARLSKVQSTAAPASIEEILSAATTTARASKAAKNGAISVVFSTNGEASSSSWKKALTRAGKSSLPILFVTRHNFAADTPHPAKRPQALSFGVPLITVDADDVLAVYRVASESISRARQRRGPTVIEAITAPPFRADASHPLSRHTAIADDTVHAMELFLAHRKLLPATLKRRIHADAAASLATATKSGAR